MEDSKHVQFIYDRLVNVYDESENTDYLIKLRQVIKTMKTQEKLEREIHETLEKRRNNE